MNRYLQIAFIAFLVMADSCTSRKNVAERKNIIPEKDLTSILTESYLADGVLVLPEIKRIFLNVDTLSTYIDIIEKYGYTKPQMDKTMRYYFVKKPKKLIKIYDKVLGKLSEEESRVDQELPGFNLTKINLWPGNPSYSFPDPSGKESACIDLDFNYVGTRYLKFTITIYPDDQSPDPVLGLYISKTDSTGNEIKIPSATFPFIKDGHPHDYNITFYQTLASPVRLKGWFIDQEGVSPYLAKHHRVDNIILSRNLID